MSEAITVQWVEEEDSLVGKYLTFLIEKETYGIPIQHVIEIIGIQRITEVPDLPVYAKGIINLRGKIIPVIDVRLKFRKPEKDYNDRTCIIVVDINEIAIGLIVDTVAEVLSIADENIVPPPELKSGFGNRYIKGIGKVGDEVKLLIDCERILENEELEVISDMG
ncbi:MAG: chemotaxis protein CheW [Clostridia bacterium]|nr:chemotaxis protein CheW [Clostridia bacterium]